jgi:hypothetical protein
MKLGGYQSQAVLEKIKYLAPVRIRNPDVV